MGKGKIITSTDNEHGLVEKENGKQIPFVQPLCKELGLKVGAMVRFDVYADPRTKEKTAYNVELYKKGIITGKDNDKGMITIQDANFGEITAQIIQVGDVSVSKGDFVKYDLLKTDKGAVSAIYVRPTENPDPDTKD